MIVSADSIVACNPDERSSVGHRLLQALVDLLRLLPDEMGEDEDRHDQRDDGDHDDDADRVPGLPAGRVLREHVHVRSTRRSRGRA